jgi:hypothetical protein
MGKIFRKIELISICRKWKLFMQMTRYPGGCFIIVPPFEGKIHMGILR